MDGTNTKPELLFLLCLLPPPGTMPNSEYLKGSKIQMTSKNFVNVDKVG